MTDFFVSYNGNDDNWAQWIAWQLESNGYSTIIQAWDFAPGSDFIQCIHQAKSTCDRVLLVLSQTYLESDYANFEWHDYMRNDPKGEKCLIVPVKVLPCETSGLLGPRVFINLLGISDPQHAVQTLLAGIGRLPALPKRVPAITAESGGENRAKPASPPRFPFPPVPAAHRPRLDYSHLTLLRVLEGLDEAELYSIAFSPDGQLVCAGSCDTALLWRIDMPTEPTSTGGHDKYVYSVAFSRDSRRIVTGCEDGFVRVWRVEPTLELLWEKREHSEAVYSVDFSPDGRRVASGGYDRSVLLWDAERGNRLRSGLEGGALAGVGRVTSVAFSPDGESLAVGSLDDTVRQWNIVEGTARILGRHESSVEDVAFSPDGRLLASCGLDKAVRLWDLAKTRKPLLWSRREHEYLVRSVAFSPDGSTLASAG